MSTMAIDLDERSYGKLLLRTLPHVIRTEDEYERLKSELLRLDELDDPSAEEKELAELLTVLVVAYEDRSYPIPKAGPHQVLRHLIEARNLKQRDLCGVLGSKGVTSEIVRGKRSISKTQAKKLAAFFHVSADLFI
ncbi:MAG TPA: helix-turn-helix domain-containing protein [Candidatus Acidoferrales bacterium]|nr:helix-turn-helix domain-containing protein [Candidatus Acidoferrales bacterium]